jgi:hypothetical protein
VTVCLPVLVTVTGMVTLLPTCTPPTATFDTESDIWAVAATENDNSERMRIQQAGLWGDPRQLMSFALFSVLAEHGGGFCRALLLAADKPGPRPDTAVLALFLRKGIFGRSRKN